MSNELTDIMLVNIRLINKTSQRLNRGHAEHNGLAGSFPPVMSENNVDLVQFKARPLLSRDILIQSGIKKTLFEARSTYAEGTITIHMVTRLLYSYEYIPFRQAPKAIFYWEHNALSAGEQNMHCRSELKRHSNIYPYSYAVDFHVG